MVKKQNIVVGDLGDSESQSDREKIPWGQSLSIEQDLNFWKTQLENEESSQIEQV